MHGWHCYIFKTYPPDKLSKLVQPTPEYYRSRTPKELRNYGNFSGPPLSRAVARVFLFKNIYLNISQR